MAMPAPLIGEMLGIETAPIRHGHDGRRHRVTLGDAVDIEVEDFVPPLNPEGEVEKLTGMFHPANSTLTVARATSSRVDACVQRGIPVRLAAAGVPAYLLTSGVERIVGERPGAATAAAVAVFTACGLYQLTSLKTRCLQHCRSPLTLLLRYGTYRGALRDVRADLHHGAYCLGCCWSLMALFVVVGVMNVPAMVGLAVVVLAEKSWSHGELLARLAGVAALVAAVAVVWFPALAPGVQAGPLMAG